MKLFKQSRTANDGRVNVLGLFAFEVYYHTFFFFLTSPQCSLKLRNLDVETPTLNGQLITHTIATVAHYSVFGCFILENQPQTGKIYFFVCFNCAELFVGFGWSHESVSLCFHCCGCPADLKPPGSCSDVLQLHLDERSFAPTHYRDDAQPVSLGIYLISVSVLACRCKQVSCMFVCCTS